MPEYTHSTGANKSKAATEILKWNKKGLSLIRSTKDTTFQEEHEEQTTTMTMIGDQDAEKTSRKEDQEKTNLEKKEKDKIDPEEAEDKIEIVDPTALTETLPHIRNNNKNLQEEIEKEKEKNL